MLKYLLNFKNTGFEASYRTKKLNFEFATEATIANNQKEKLITYAPITLLIRIPTYWLIKLHTKVRIQNKI